MKKTSTHAYYSLVAVVRAGASGRTMRTVFGQCLGASCHDGSSPVVPEAVRPRMQ